MTYSCGYPRLFKQHKWKDVTLSGPCPRPHFLSPRLSGPRGAAVHCILLNGRCDRTHHKIGFNRSWGHFRAAILMGFSEGSSKPETLNDL